MPAGANLCEGFFEIPFHCFLTKIVLTMNRFPLMTLRPGRVSLLRSKLMAWLSRISLAGIVAVCFTSAVAAQGPDKTSRAVPPREYRWEDEAKRLNLDDDEIRLLRENKFVIGAPSFRQIFKPYVGSDVPVFITTDSLLNGFHVLLEESIYRLEQAHARKLPTIVERIWNALDRIDKQLKGDADLLAAAKKRARVFIGTARQLLDAKAWPEDPALRALIKDEAERITAAREMTKPAWLGPPDGGFVALDYSRFLLRGFYTKSPGLQRYFRALSWLQAIPFRLDKDDELAAFFLLHRACFDPAAKDQTTPEFWDVYRSFLGTPDDWDLPSAQWTAKIISKEGLADVRKRYQDWAGTQGLSEINDQLRFPPANSDGKPEIGFRFVSAYRLPDGVLFQRTMKAGKDRMLPTGLEIAAALGSPFAQEKIAREMPAVWREIQKSDALFEKAPHWKGGSLYNEYLQCLRVLLERTEPDAPKFFHRVAWKIKTCQTALAAWVQMRHTWVLQAKPAGDFLCSVPFAPGYVEPVPEFYRLFAALIVRTNAELAKAGAFTYASKKEFREELAALAVIVEKVRKAENGFAALTPDERLVLEQFDPLLEDWDRLPAKDGGKENALRLISLILQLAHNADEDMLDALEALVGRTGPTAGLWDTLATVTQRLESLSHKQLRQVDLSKEEIEFLTYYGTQLARVMLYGGNSYFTPRDDAMRIVDVFSNPQMGKQLLVGTGRPRTLWVLYPVKGVDILCRGAVAPYYEFASADKLTDGSWKTLLDSPQRPETPRWIQPVMSSEMRGQ
jgi:hypothetical protein